MRKPKPKAGETKLVIEMTDQELLDRDMSQAEWGRRLSKRPKNKAASERAKSNPAQLEQLARARIGTRLGEPGLPTCTATAKSTGLKCNAVAVRGEPHCWKHATLAEKVRLKDRRREEGRPVDFAGAVAKRNLKSMLRQNRIPRELMLVPQFQAVMQIVAPTWFGRPVMPLGVRLTRQDIHAASLLSREMVLAWAMGSSTGDWLPWTQAVMKARALGYHSPASSPH